MVSWSPLTFSFLPHLLFFPLSSLVQGLWETEISDVCVEDIHNHTELLEVFTLESVLLLKRKISDFEVFPTLKSELWIHPAVSVLTPTDASLTYFAGRETLFPQSGDNCRITDPTVRTSCRSLRLNWCRLWLHNSAQLVAGGSRNIAALFMQPLHRLLQWTSLNTRLQCVFCEGSIRWDSKPDLLCV